MEDNANRTRIWGLHESVDLIPPQIRAVLQLDKENEIKNN